MDKKPSKVIGFTKDGERIVGEQAKRKGKSSDLTTQLTEKQKLDVSSGEDKKSASDEAKKKKGELNPSRIYKQRPEKYNMKYED